VVRESEWLMMEMIENFKRKEAFIRSQIAERRAQIEDLEKEIENLLKL
jgi:diketogulonate reductase-like aldo/keto reductase